MTASADDPVRAVPASACTPSASRRRVGWTRRHTAFAIVLLPFTWWFLASSAGFPGGPGWLAALSVMAAGSAVVSASYLPARSTGMPRARASVWTSCAITPALLVVCAGLLLSLGPELPGRAFLALLAVGAGVFHRLAGRATCR